MFDSTRRTAKLLFNSESKSANLQWRPSVSLFNFNGNPCITSEVLFFSNTVSELAFCDWVSAIGGLGSILTAPSGDRRNAIPRRRAKLQPISAGRTRSTKRHTFKVLPAARLAKFEMVKIQQRGHSLMHEWSLLAPRAARHIVEGNGFYNEVYRYILSNTAECWLLVGLYLLCCW
jgi:hypothetical protein